MNKLYATLFVFMFCATLSFAQKNNLITEGLRPIEEVPLANMPFLDNDQLVNEEVARRNNGIPNKFAESIEVNIKPTTHGLWENAANNMKVWRLRIQSAGAKSLNLGFSQYYLPRNSKLILYKPDGSNVMGPFTPSDNEDHNQLWTPILEGDEMVLELQVPANQKSKLELELSYVNHDFMGFAQKSGAAGSGSCNLDVVCGEADGWGIVDKYRDIIRSVAVYSYNGSFECTGFLINNTNSDCTPFFMTAAHCGLNSGNASSLVTYWNFESPECRQPGSSDSGSPGNGTLDDFNTGSIHRVTYGPSDVTLVELDDAVSSTADAFFAGWSIEYEMPEDTVICIHHPDTDEKRITFEFDPTVPTISGADSLSIDDASHIRVPGWDVGTTEGGSSGSPLFNKNKQVVGQLHGGAASCNNASNSNPNDDWDYYGWFHTSWYGGGTPNTALRFWLDPYDTGFETWDGKENCSYNISATPYYRELCAPEEATYLLENSSNFDGEVTLTASNVPVGATISFSQNPFPSDANSTLTITTSGVATGVYAIKIDATDGTNESVNTVLLKVTESAPSQVTVVFPENEAAEITTSPLLAWSDNPSDEFYQVEVATDPGFTNIIAESADLENPTFGLGFLDILTTYYWRVKVNNICGESEWSAVWSFTTADIDCSLFEAVDTPVSISMGDGGVYTSIININANAIITDLDVFDIDILHSYVGDLSATLQSPEGTTVELFNRPGVPESMFGCDNADLFVSFDDNATAPYSEFEEACDDNPAVGGIFQPISPLSPFNGENTIGDWTLTVTDHVFGDGGSINGWALQICTSEFEDISLTASPNAIETCTENDVQFTITLGEDFETTGVNLSISGNPAGSTASFDSNPGMPGEAILVTISNITTAGNFQLEVTADDGSNNASTTVSISSEAAPAVSTLTNPANDATNVSLTTTLEWAASANADNYLVEIATDDSFTNIVDGTTTSNNSFTIPTPLEYNTNYVWRVVANNECGETFSMTSAFTTEINIAVEELEGNAFKISPNPTTGNILVSFEKAINKELIIEVYAIDGKLLQQAVHVSGQRSVPVALDYTSGVYILRLKTDKAAVARRVIVQR